MTQPDAATAAPGTGAEPGPGPAGRLSRRLARALAPTLGRLPVWVVLLGIYLLTRVWGWIVFSLVARQQGTNPWVDGPMDYGRFIGMWDADWYRQIAATGYPQQLPTDPDGHVRQNPWAFYPLFPLAARALMRVTGLGFVPAGAAISVACGAVTAVLLYGFFRACRRDGRPAGLTAPARTIDVGPALATALVLLNPIAPILQVPYAESMSLMFLVSVLWALTARRWGICAVLLVPTCLSRPVGVPLGAALGLWWLVGWIRAARRARAEASSSAGRTPGRAALRALRQTRAELALALFACACALIWPGIAWAVTGRPDAYTATETAWRGEHLLPVQPWFQQARVFFGDAGWLALALLLLGAWALLGSRAVRRSLPGAVRMWLGCYGVYLLVFLFPQSSTFRLLLPAFPLAAPLVEVSRSRGYRVLLLVGAGLGQLLWVGWLWHWKELPSGGDFPP